MNERNPFLFAMSLVTSWTGTIGTILLNHLNLLLTLACGVASLFASLYAIRVARETIREKRAHREKIVMETCIECKGDLERCPLSVDLRPRICPRNRNKNNHKPINIEKL